MSQHAGCRGVVHANHWHTEQCNNVTPLSASRVVTSQPGTDEATFVMEVMAATCCQFVKVLCYVLVNLAAGTALQGWLVANMLHPTF